MTSSHDFSRGIPRRGVHGCAFPRPSSTLSRGAFDGGLPITTEGVRSSAYSPAKRAFPPGRAGRFDEMEYRSIPPRQGIQPAGCRHSRPTRGPGRGGVVLRLCYHAASYREAVVRSKTAFANEGTPSYIGTRRPNLMIWDRTPSRLWGGGLVPTASASSHP